MIEHKFKNMQLLLSEEQGKIVSGDYVSGCFINREGWPHPNGDFIMAYWDKMDDNIEELIRSRLHAKRIKIILVDDIQRRANIETNDTAWVDYDFKYTVQVWYED